MSQAPSSSPAPAANGAVRSSRKAPNKHARTRSKWRNYGRFLRDVFGELGRDDVPLLAAALAHYLLLGLVPLLLLATAVAGYVFKDPTNVEWASDAITTSFPVKPEVITTILESMSRRSNTVGGFGIAALLWISMRIFVTLQKALDHIWDIDHHEKRPFYLQWVVALPTVLFVGLFAWASFVVTGLVSSLPRYWPDVLNSAEARLPDIVAVATIGASTVLSIVLMFMIYRLLPSARPRSRSAIVGAVVAGTLWEAAKHVFAFYVTRYAQMDRVYGAMANFVIVILWTFISSLILLFGAEVVACHAEWIAVTPITEDVPPAPPAAEPADEPDRSVE